jgi:Sec-independent protein translocase protein TatA
MGSAIGKSIKEFQKGIKEISTPKDDEPATSMASVEREPVVVKHTTPESSTIDKTTVE